MSKTTIVTMAVKDLSTNLFVRQALNHDHVLYLGALAEGGVKLPPIKVTSKGEVIDGRHRKEAYELLNWTHVEVEIVQVGDDKELIAAAYKANVGGSLPPSSEDTEHTIGLLLDRGVSKKSIGELLGLPPSMARTYVNSVQSKIARTKVMNAAAAVTDGGLTIATASEKYGVESEKLKEVLSGHRRKHKHGVAEIQKGVTFNFKSLGCKNAALMRSLFEKYEDGDVTERQMLDIFEHIKQLQKRATRCITDWEKRFRAKANGGSVSEDAQS